jgi:metal-responsive CopG/Arc/MetJ family transcriptional regulator
MPIPQVSTIPTPIDINSKYYGPQEKEKIKGEKAPREKYGYAFNETNSLIDLVAYKANIEALTAVMSMEKPPQSLKGRVRDIREIKEKLADDPAYENKSKRKLIEEAVKRYVDNPKNLQDKTVKKTTFDIVIATTEKERDLWLNPVALTDKYSPGIREHLHRRVDLYLMQLLNCYGTRLHFEIGSTQHQAESSHSLYVEYNGEVDKVCKKGPTHNAAHSSTFPCLVAYDEEEWEQYKDGEIDKPTGTYFLQNSDLYKATNSTCSLLRSVNQADLAVDGNEHDSPFSNQALNFINQVSKGDMSVKTAMKNFLKTLETDLPGKIRVAKDPAVKAALHIYQNELEEISKEFNEDRETWIFSKADLIVDHEEISNTLRATMLRLRTDSIKRNMQGQTELISKVDALAKTILAEMTANDKSAPNYFKEAFHLAVIDAMRTDEDRKRIAKVFSLANPNVVGTRKVAMGNTQTKIEAAALVGQTKRIEKLAKTLSKDMRSLRTEEVLHRGDAMRALRAAKKWTQETLGSKLQKKFPTQFSSQPTMCRTERGERIMTNKLAQQLSSIFEVPKELLLPQVFFI